MSTHESPRRPDADAADDIEATEATPLQSRSNSKNSNKSPNNDAGVFKGTSGGMPGCCSCTPKKFMGCSSGAPLGTGFVIMLIADFVVAILLIVSGAIWLNEGGCLALANGVLLFIGIIIGALAIFIRDRDWANVFVWICICLHCLLALLVFVGFIWQAVNLGDCDSNFATNKSKSDCQAGSAIGMVTQVVYLPFLIFFICSMNGWRVHNMGGRNLNQIFKPVAAAACDAANEENKKENNNNDQNV